MKRLAALGVFAACLLAAAPAAACGGLRPTGPTSLMQLDAQFARTATFAVTGVVIGREVNGLQIQKIDTLRGEAADGFLLEKGVLIDCDAPPLYAIPDNIAPGQTVLVIGASPAGHVDEFRYAVPLDSRRGRRLLALLSRSRP